MSKLSAKCKNITVSHSYFNSSHPDLQETEIITVADKVSERIIESSQNYCYLERPKNFYQGCEVSVSTRATTG